MEGTWIFQGTVMVDKNSGKVYLVSNNSVVDFNEYLAKEIGDEVVVTVTGTKEDKSLSPPQALGDISPSHPTPTRTHNSSYVS